MSKYNVRLRFKLSQLAALTCLLMFLSPIGAEAAYQNGIYRDVAEGYNSRVIVTVTVRDGQITELSAENESGEKSEYFIKAEEGLSKAILEQQGIEGVDTVSGATGTSESILSAMEGILKQAAYTGTMAGGAPAQNGTDGMTDQPSAADDGVPQALKPDGSAGPAPQSGAIENGTTTPQAGLDMNASELYWGLGSVSNSRVGPGKDSEGTQVYSFNVAMASVLFDRDGRMLDVQVDVYEVASPNYDGASMPHFSGWPGTEGYNVTDTSTGKVTGTSKNTEELFEKELADWRTKRERGDAYGMNPSNEWYRQMNAYEQWMIGQTVAEVREWFTRYTSERNGRPIKADSDNEEDQKKLASYSEEEKTQLADAVSRATMSLSDGHGRILEAIEKAYDNRTPVGASASE